MPRSSASHAAEVRQRIIDGADRAFLDAFRDSLEDHSAGVA